MGALKSLVNARNLQYKYTSLLHQAVLVAVLLYDNETMEWRDKERSRISVLQIYNFRSLLGNRSMDKLTNAWVRELCGVMHGGVLWLKFMLM